MTLSTKSALDAAPKVYLRSISQTAHNTGTMLPWSFRSGSNQNPPAFTAVSNPAALAAGGTLWANGSTGFYGFPATASQIYSINCVDDLGTDTAASKLLLLDFVWGVSGIDGTVLTAQSVTGFPVLTRPDANGTGLELFVVTWAAVTTAASTLVTVSYTNSAGVAGRTASLLYGATTAFGLANTVAPMKLQAGDTGVKSIQSVTIGTAQTGAGNIGLILAKRVCMIEPSRQGASKYLSGVELGFPAVDANAALNFFCMALGVTNFVPDLEIALAQG